MGRCLNLVHFEHGAGVANIANDRQAAEARDCFAQQFELLASSICQLGRQASDVAARLRQARDQFGTKRVRRRCKHNRYRRCRLLDREGGAAPDVTMTSTLSLTNSAAISAIRSLRPSPQRYSIATVRPSTHPRSRNRCTKAATNVLWYAVPRKHLVEPIADFDHRAISAILMRAARA
jgi:hypothetical protein